MQLEGFGEPLLGVSLDVWVLVELQWSTRNVTNQPHYEHGIITQTVGVSRISHTI